MSHTPGPWDFDDNRPGFVTARGGPDICEVFGEAARGDECDSNHALIAAAPELLAALRLARDDLSDLLEVSDLTDEGVADTTEVLNKVIAAIAKAEGRGE